MRFFMAALAAMFFAIAAPAPAAHAQQTGVVAVEDVASIADTRWGGAASWYDGETRAWELHFRADGVLIYSYDGNTYDNGRWTQNNKVVTFNTNNYFAVYVGLIDGRVLRGSSFNRRGSTGTFIFVAEGR